LMDEGKMLRPTNRPDHDGSRPSAVADGHSTGAPRYRIRSAIHRDPRSTGSSPRRVRTRSRVCSAVGCTVTQTTWVFHASLHGPGPPRGRWLASVAPYASHLDMAAPPVR
jgi:hypothetical protein